MVILGIETSCDETAASIVEDGTKILSNVVASSQELHIKTGGIIPEVAAREQIKCIIPVINEAMEQCDNGAIDSLAVTIGPGLIGSLLVGVETAKTLAYLWQKPIIPVNHLLAHVYANWLFAVPQPLPPSTLSPFHYNNIYYHSENDSNHFNEPQFPAVALIVSGGHTELILMKDHGKYIWLGGTRDDAAGETFDKIARLLGLGYPGGPAISAAAEKYFKHRHAEFISASPRHSGLTGYRPVPVLSRIKILNQVQDDLKPINLPRPMLDSDDFDFSFSGLKTAVIRELKNLTSHYNNIYYHSETPVKSYLPPKIINQIAFEVQEAITDVLVKKTIRAAKVYKVKTVLLAGGVAANQRLREKILRYYDTKSNIEVFIPEPKLCTDNAACVASCAYFNFKPVPWQKIQALPSLEL